MENTNIYTWPEVLEAHRSNKYKKVCLYDTQGKKIIAYKNNRTDPKKKLEEIERKLKTKQLPDGYYLVHFKQSFSTAVDPEVYMIKKGNPTEAPTLSEPTKGTPAVQILTYEQALKYETDILRLTAERDKALADYDKLLEEMEAEPEEVELAEPAGGGAVDLANSIGTWIEKITPTLVPVIDRYMTQRDKQIENQQAQTMADLMKQGYTVQQPGDKKPPPPPPGASNGVEFSLDNPPNEGDPHFMKWMAWVGQNHPVEYELILKGEYYEEEPEEPEA